MSEPTIYALKSIITVSEARKLLGKDARSLNDTQIEEIILSLNHIAQKYLKNKGSKIIVGIDGQPN